MDVYEFKLKALPLKNKIFRTAKRFLKDESEAEDAAQEVLIKLWQKRDSLSKYESLEAIAITATKNMCIDTLRKNKTEKLQINEETTGGNIKTPDAEYENNEAMSLVEKAIDMLPDRQKLVVHLRDIEGYSSEEIARIMEIERGNVRVLLSRARKQIRNYLTQQYSYKDERN